jgi:hypothetical protein
MQPDATYSIVHHLERAGQWDLALEVLGERDPDLRAELVAERFFWQGVPADMSVIDAAAPEHALILHARISYYHRLFKLEGGEELDEAAIFAAAPGGWASFWHGVVQDNVHHNAELAKASYAKAAELDPGDAFLESYVVRHQGFHLLETDRPRGLALMWRSLRLRAALGARPHVAAAMGTLAHFLGKDDPAYVELNELALATAHELRLSWILRAAEEGDE